MDPAQVIELNALRYQEPMNAVIERGDSNVQQFYRDATVFLTGGSGFIGKQLIEKLFRSCAIKKLYMLTRPKKGKTIQQRLDSMFEDPLYERLRSKQPKFADKIIPVEGDVTQIRLGLNERDWARLTQEVSVIFHVAATIRFDEPLRKATFTNLRGTREVLVLAKQCGNLKKLIHVSTAFCHATLERTNTDVAEEFYPCPIPPHTMIALAEELDEAKMNNITKGLIDGWPNTYTFTKALAEELVRTSSDNLPVCVVRPPIVLPTYYEPNPGWLDVSTIMGPSGVYLGGGIGVLRVFHTDISMDLYVAPLDYVNNAIIAAGWDSTLKTDGTDVPIYTIKKPLRYGFISETMRRYREQLSCPKCVWWPYLFEVKSKFLYFLMSWYFHYIPAYLVDMVVVPLGLLPKEVSSIVDIFKKVDKLSDLYDYFIANTWNMKDDNLQKMIARMSDADRAIYNCDVSTFDAEEFIKVWGIGLRKYIVKDGLVNTAEGFKKQSYLKILHFVVFGIYTYGLWWVACLIFSLISSVLGMFF
ncbi:fatty acyl-CoA reductase wat-like [Anticarsia gemmatalis]|uniref:fatty acyl-CoA reductase wat-like n=1 Tax=Anticarsia gemmatalis TaxID=129554 RepID=UPI003F775CDF